MLKFKADKLSLVIVFLTLAFEISLMAVNIQNLRSWQIVLLLFFGSFLTFNVSLINHNHRHNSIFNSNRLNIFLNHLISIGMGVPSTRLHLVHQWNHHRYYKSSEDWSCYKNNTSGTHFVRLIRYLINTSFRISEGRKTLKIPKTIRNLLFNEWVTISFFILSYLLINWRVFIFIILPIWFIGLYSLLTANLLDHDECDLNSDFNHSRNFTNLIENKLFFNSGFHGSHHLHPHMHWSKLKSYHYNYLSKHNDHSLNVNSYFMYLIENYILPRKLFENIIETIIPSHIPKNTPKG